ncbi:ABC transporter permease [Chloroflexus sp.]|uniref:ABC transporter permease n=1 Tax=Chloroflexus sp. TaxID=1904827 RepID=UPI00261FBBC4|nr:ABC transporter permease [uncultured Chloroflexus sp.]
MASLFWHELRIRRGVLIGWSAGMLAFFSVYMAFYPALPVEMRNLDLASIELYRAFGNLTMATFEGYIGSTIFHFFTVLLCVLAIVTGTGVLAGEEDNGTLELQLALPLTRWQLVTTKTIALAAMSLLVLGVASIAAAVIFLFIRDQLTTQLDAGDLFRATVAHWPLVFLFQTLSLWLGTLTPSRRVALALATVILVVSFLGYNLLSMSPDLEYLRPLSPFHYRPSTPAALNEGPASGDLVTLLGAALLGYGLAVVCFNQRDVTTGAWLWARYFHRVSSTRKVAG